MNDFVTLRDGAKIHVVDCGAGIPIVFIHGTGLDTRMWKAQIDFFAERYRTIAYDMRGFGRSSALTGAEYSSSSDLEALLIELEIENAHIVALSRGARAAITFALDHPQRVRTLALAGANINGLKLSPEFAAIRDDVARHAAAEGVESAKRAWIECALFESARAHEDVSRAIQEMLDDYDGWHWMHRDPEKRTKPEAEARLEEIEAPCLVVVGERDLPHFHAAARLLVRRLPHAERVEIAGVGHMSPMEAPERFNRVLTSFLERHVDGARA